MGKNRDTGGMAESNKNVKCRQKTKKPKQQKAVLGGELSHSCFHTLISAAVEGKDFPGVSPSSPQESNHKGGSAARKSNLDIPLGNVLALAEPHSLDNGVQGIPHTLEGLSWLWESLTWAVITWGSVL